MKYDVILAGVGGQGVLSIAAIIAQAAGQAGLSIKQSEVHGMSQRGGAVESHLRLADHPIHSDLIPTAYADMVLAMEPMEALRYVPFLSPAGVIVTDRTPVVNIPNYPEAEDVYAALEQFPCSRLVDTVQIARDLHAVRSSNMVLLGAASAFLPLDAADLEAAIDAVFGRKGEAVVAQNVAAFRAGREAASVPAR
ncbi:MAG TPA: indolepyruvate oxidoreductase subunit beta [Aggregatilinea sp.]|jgi:indolepyruvate ferredoxin oxidoreductase beta subunit|uniref:indolepyruvate oxidoreductase subunit beta n=1 Tax=Aggregatilinea sp. TaxID=2806333 RepID=UPI002C13F1F8|nr:indolepyruvate oxidoreductase subunit beta [Aggregatilinea sp.]HML23247.1 indolepyruvate oxidoreductase subunit beta [Aggregatilinea sp.]